jgi:hypothetical protein
MAILGTISAHLEIRNGKDVLNKEKTNNMSFGELKRTI